MNGWPQLALLVGSHFPVAERLRDVLRFSEYMIVEKSITEARGYVSQVNPALVILNLESISEELLELLLKLRLQRMRPLVVVLGAQTAILELARQQGFDVVADRA